jgi:ABC-type transporter Mla maintaining outer membrane lipid asymmetry ATPase subunit MlaF
MTATPLAFEETLLPRSGAPVKLDVPAHHTVLVLGPDASGVDALPAIALGLERPAAGRALLFGVEVAALAPPAALAFRRRVGYLPAGDGLLQNLTLRDNVALPLSYGSDYTDREIASRVQILLTLVRIAAAADRRPAAATEEERRRAALARALAFDPDLVILASPFDGLTTRAAAELLEVARGGETGEGARRALLITAQDIPDRLAARIEARYRFADGELRREN